MTCLLCYCSEGDNIPDAFLLAEAASKLTGLSPHKFHGNKFPSLKVNNISRAINRESQ